MSKAQFISAVSNAVTTYNESPQGTEDKQMYLEALTAANKSYTGEPLPAATTWPC